MLSVVGVQAQFDTHFTHYWALQGYYNPAVAGLSGRLNMYGTYAMQMAGYTNAPTTKGIDADTDKRAWWKMLQESQHTGVSYDVDSVWLLFFDKARYKDRYWISLKK